MEKSIRLIRQVSGITLELEALRLGEDMSVILHGGKAHIGAVALAEPRPGLADPQKTGASASVITRLGHKEDELARAVALYLAAECRAAVSVTCGIHKDAASAADISAIVDTGLELAAELAGVLKNLP
jgi:hypothetical protein